MSALKNMESLESPQYTLVSIAVDTSGSTGGFINDLAMCVSSIISACKRFPDADSLLVRVTTFASHIREVHPWKKIVECEPSDYVFSCDGCTVLNSACFDAISAIQSAGANLANQDYMVNGISIVITDGMPWQDSRSTHDVSTIMSQVTSNESIESIRTILIGLGNEPELDNYRKNVHFDQFVRAEDASATMIAKVAEFVSKSISMQSQALGTGVASVPITF